VKEFLSHCSTLVYRYRALSACRFDEGLWYGEDYLFLLDLLDSSSRTCVSAEAEAALGFGVNIFFNSWSWDSSANVKRFCYCLIAHKRMRTRCRFRPELYKLLNRTIQGYRPPLTFFILRELAKGRISNVPLLLLLREDLLFFAAFPLNTARATIQWISGKIQGIPVFHGR
jgi:hypothetical protein